LKTTPAPAFTYAGKQEADTGFYLAQVQQRDGICFFHLFAYSGAVFLGISGDCCVVHEARYFSGASKPHSFSG
jgi:hypothetical protein